MSILNVQRKIPTLVIKFLDFILLAQEFVSWGWCSSSQMSSFEDRKQDIFIKENVKNEPIDRNMDNQKEYLLVFRNMKYTNNQKRNQKFIVNQR